MSTELFDLTGQVAVVIGGAAIWAATWPKA